MDRDLCANCDQWREQHYNKSGIWIGDRIGCVEYQGSEPTDERREKKKKEIAAARAK